MRYKISDIVYESGKFFVLPCDYGFEVWESGITHAKRCAQIGWHGDVGLDKAKAEIERRKIKEPQ